MNWWQVLGSGVLTALLALVLVPLAARHLPQARPVALLLAVVLGLPFHEAAGNALEDLLSPPATPAEAAARKWGRATARIPEVLIALAGRTQAEADAMAAGFVEAGLGTLTDGELDDRARILKRLVDGPDDTLAAGLFTGQVDPGRLKAALDRLQPAQIERWYALGYKATLGSFHDAVSHPPDAREKARAIRELVAATQLDGTRLLGVMLDPHPKVADAAWAARKIYDTLFTLPPRRRAAVERALVAPGLTTS